ncbi:hypothetical protein DICPUDRAFT_39079 [Dictyostelium purpureum]|uniref:NIPSNAP domain-containing protein n=1 Tax=Dictyostelium purpureum TaxID=5786 RepID=F0ZVN8_DICPU|nr:uncharacterized protein DICPUDRAFT_39079 [Dictyostelium purpureum]EGC31979.1 hypothetical protein DICPUDRAFT_39079 [Dictyostelium purpureum]|eukprot:XP_003291477.1 hypothetical protein DICPUDRAFT_39079 [Dictyostelium purpureum]
MIFRNSLLKNNVRYFSTASGSPVFELITYKPTNKTNFIKQLKGLNSKLSSDNGNQSPLINVWETDLGSKFNDEVICFLKFSNNEERLKTIQSFENTFKDQKTAITLDEFQWAKFSGISKDQLKENKVWELRTYQTKPGKIDQWEKDFTKGFNERKTLSGPVGVWNGNLEDSKAVVHLWPYKSFEHRMSVRNAALKMPIWLETVKNTTASLTSMESKVILPINL